MNKSELIEAIAASADIPKAAASRALDAMIESVTDSLKKGDSVALVGFGTFTVKERAARTGRNPQTGEPINISAAKVPSFKAVPYPWEENLLPSTTSYPWLTTKKNLAPGLYSHCRRLLIPIESESLSY